MYVWVDPLIDIRISTHWFIAFLKLQVIDIFAIPNINTHTSGKSVCIIHFYNFYNDMPPFFWTPPWFSLPKSLRDAATTSRILAIIPNPNKIRTSSWTYGDDPKIQEWQAFSVKMCQKLDTCISESLTIRKNNLNFRSVVLLCSLNCPHVFKHMKLVLLFTPTSSTFSKTVRWVVVLVIG